MSDQGGSLRRSLGGNFSADEISTWLDEVIAANPKRRVRGIAVSNAVFQKLGEPDNHDGVPIAMDPKLYPEDVIEVRFE